MEKFIQFVINHWLLWVALVGVVILLVYEELKDKIHGVTRLDSQETTQQLNRNEAIAIDIRDRKSYEQGHILGAITLPATELEANLNKLDKYKDKTLIIIDEAGQNTKVAAKIRNKGFKLAVLKGGINGWVGAGFPLSKK